MANYPPVTVIIPVYNGERFLESSLASVFSQTYASELQIIVIDDGSTDNSSSIAKKYSEVDYHYQQNGGVSAARNAGIELAEGEFIAFLDADDIWLPEKLSIQMKYMLSHPECRATKTLFRNFLEPGTELAPHLRNNPEWETLEAAIPSTMIVKKSVFEEAGTFSSEFQSGEDTEWIWRVKDANISIKQIEKVLTRRRYHGSNLSWKTSAGYSARLLRIIRDSVARKSQQKSSSKTNLTNGD